MGHRLIFPGETGLLGGMSRKRNKLRWLTGMRIPHPRAAQEVFADLSASPPRPGSG
jgi:hypothetical protein